MRGWLLLAIFGTLVAGMIWVLSSRVEGILRHGGGPQANQAWHAREQTPPPPPATIHNPFVEDVPAK